MHSATFLSTPAPYNVSIPAISINDWYPVCSPPSTFRDQRLRHSSRSAIMANAQDEVHGKKSPRIMVSEVVDEPDKKLDAGANAFVTRPASMQHHQHHPHQEQQQQTTFATTPPSSSSSSSFFSPPCLLSPNNNNNNPEYDHSSSTTRRYPIEDPASLPPLPPQALLSHSTFSPDTEDADDKDESNMHLRSIRPLHNDSVPGFTPLDTGASSPFIKAIRKAQKKRRGSVGEGTLRRQKAISAPVEPRLTKSSTHAQQRRHRPISNITTTSSPLRTHQEEDDSNDHWDPHIDAFEVLRAKITGITRTMQEFHVQELFYDELTERNNNRQRHHTIATTTTYQRRMSTSAESPCDPTPNHLLMDKSQSHTNRHRRIRSHGSAADFDSTTNAINSPPPPPPAPTADETRYHENNDPWSHLRTDEDFEHDLRHKSTTFSDDDELDLINNRNNDDYNYDDDDDLTISPPMAPTSPNLTALFLTTNSLINSRLDELSETASIASSCGGGDDINQSSSNEWRLQFLDLVSACITQSEELESLSTELLGTERRVRELLVINGTVNEQYHEREKAYEERIRECEEVAKQQLIMIDTLEELMADIDMKLTHHLDHNDYEHDADSGIEDDTDRSVEEDEQRWDFKRAVADILGVETQGDLVHKMRWEVGMFVGGGVGTGHVIHSFEGQLRGIEMMIAGSGTTVEDSPLRISQQDQIDETTHISRSLPRNKFHHHHYMLHISARDRKTRFRMIPQAHWVPDQMASHCQFTSKRPCSVKFSLFQRRHHCRKCGIVVCQRHSGNRLPLFAKSSAPPQWSRVCDKCFCNLIMTGDE